MTEGSSNLTAPVSVSIVEDDKEIREHLAFLLGKTDTLRFISQHGSCEAALRDLPALNPQVVLMDINLPGQSGIVGVSKLKAVLPKTQFIMLTVHEDSEAIFQSLLAGATGYMLKRTPTAELVDAIHQVVKGGSPMSSSIARKVVQFVAGQGVRGGGVTDLTERERNVLQLLAKGLMYKEIAGQLDIQIDTVRNHIRAIYDKLQVHSRTEAVVKYLQNL